MTRQLISSGSTFEREIGYSRAVVVRGLCSNDAGLSNTR